MATIVFDVTLFRARFPVYADPIDYPDALLQDFWNQAICYVSDENCGIIVDDCRLQLINYMTAHLIYIWNLVNDQNGEAAGGGGVDDTNLTTSAAIGDVSGKSTPAALLMAVSLAWFQHAFCRLSEPVFSKLGNILSPLMQRVFSMIQN